MKSKNLIIVLVILLLLLGFAYFISKTERGSQLDESVSPGDNQSKIALKVGGEEIFNNELGIKLLKIVSDSRCPLGVKCVWAGEVTAEIELKSGSFLGKVTLSNRGGEYMFENYLIKLTQVRPEKRQEMAILQDEYMAFFSIKRAESVSMDGKSISGIKGAVTIGPACPVQRVEDKNCDDKPFQASFVIKDKKEDVLKRFESSQDGNFSVEVSPGNYVIYVDYGNSLSQSKPEYVTVEERKFTDVIIRVDSGVR